MKAAQIMLFLLLLLLSIEMINASNIYVIGGTPSEYKTTTEDVDDPYSIPTEEGINVSSLLGRIFSLITAGVLTGVIFGAGARIFGGVPADRAFIYGVFASSFWGMVIDACFIFNSIAPYNPGLIMIISIFLIVCGAVFVIGFKQLVTGGWQAFM